MLTCTTVERPGPRAEKQGDEKWSKATRANKIKLTHAQRVVALPGDVKIFHQDEIKRDGAEQQEQPRVGAPDFRAIKLQQHQAADEDDER